MATSYNCSDAACAKKMVPATAAKSAIEQAALQAATLAKEITTTSVLTDKHKT